MVGVIEYKAGNAPSVLNALKKLQIESMLISTAEDFNKVDRIILPGVGVAKATMDSLRELGFIGVMTEKVLKDKVPFLGICVGLQVLFEHSEEGDTECLKWLPGTVRRFSDRVRVPQIGWNEVIFNENQPINAGLAHSEFFYFVNSYYVLPGDTAIVLGETEYDHTFCSMISCGNIFATQFHIEKSGVTGLKILKNFCGISGGKSC